MAILNLTGADFDSAIANGRFLVDFWAAWCMPCRMVAPVIEELAVELENVLTVAKVDTDEESALVARYEIMSIPTVILFEDGKEAKRFLGVRTKQQYMAEL